MDWRLTDGISLDDEQIRWQSFGEGPPIVLVHGTPYSSFVWREVAPALSRAGWKVFVFDHLGYGESDQREGQDLSLKAQGRRFAQLLSGWGLERPSVVACDIGGAIALRALLLEGVSFRDLTLFDAVTGGRWERGLFAMIREHHEIFEQLPAYAHRAFVAAHLGQGTHLGYRSGVLDTYLAPWLGESGQAAFYRQYRQLDQADTEEYEHLLADIDIPVRLLWGREDQILPPPYGVWIEERVPSSGVTWIDDAGHLLPEDVPAQLVERLVAPW